MLILNLILMMLILFIQNVRVVDIGFALILLHALSSSGRHP